MGRRKTTGRYESRDELVIMVWRWYDMGNSMEEVARICRVSAGTVAKILNAGRPSA